MQANRRPFTIRHLGHKLSKNGKKVWKYFQPFDMRNCCAVARLIKTKVESKRFDAYSVKNWLGHTQIKTTEGYIRYAKQYYNQIPVDWIAAALKPELVGTRNGKKINKEKINRTSFLGLLTIILSRSRSGPAEI